MIQNQRDLLTDQHQPGTGELCRLLDELLEEWGASPRLVEQQSLQSPNPAVYRLRFKRGTEIRSLVVKRMEARIGQRNELAMKRWLPSAGLAQGVPALLGVAAERNGRCVWHVYEDLGTSALACDPPDWPGVQAVVELIAAIHDRFTDHHLLPECRLYGGDLGVHFFTSNVNDALRCLRALNKAAPAMPTGQRSLCDRLLDRIELLKREEPLRAQILNELDGPETLLHGDLWTTNTFVTHSEDGSHARLIDWDHAAAGPASYDLSTFLLRFPRRYRARIFDHYVKAARRMDWALAPREEINFLFETAELARIANRIIWPAIAVLQDGAGWGIEMLAEIERWFESMDRLFFEYERTDGKETMAV